MRTTGVSGYLGSSDCDPNSEKYQYGGWLKLMTEAMEQKAEGRESLPLDEAIQVAMETAIEWNLVEH